ncbi:YdiU family protein [Gammaproteobacteria bacterium]|nr:YdiU family protein [Gammaproteobacteria bacterium]
MPALTPSPVIDNTSFRFDNSYARLPEYFFQRILPVPVKMPNLICLNYSLLEELGLSPDLFRGESGSLIFSGNLIPAGAEPIALAYSGHQFGHFVPQLGDGRAVLLGEITDLRGKRRDIQLKGSGKTAFSRNGDGRAALGPAIREYILSEAMHALGIPTNRALALVTTGENVVRENILPGAILTRLASSHVRVGTFEFFASRNDIKAIKLLADYVIDRLYPRIKGRVNPYLALIECVLDAQVQLIARWMHVGFIHGVMNTDNMAISGETIDYGPCAFMDAYDPMTVFSSIDQFGRYAYSNQSKVGQWNLASLAECLLPLVGEDEKKNLAKIREIIEGFAGKFSAVWLEGMISKLGLISAPTGDAIVVQQLLDLMEKHEADYTSVFRQLCDAVHAGSNVEGLTKIFSGDSLWIDWLGRWRKRLEEGNRTLEQVAQGMRCVNPVFIPRNHLVEQAISSAVEKNDFSLMETMQKLLATPYLDQPLYREYSDTPKPEERIYETFCGT